MQPMTKDELRAWLELRGVRTEVEMERWLADYAGRTQAEMDDLYESMHGDIA